MDIFTKTGIVTRAVASSPGVSEYLTDRYGTMDIDGLEHVLDDDPVKLVVSYLLDELQELGLELTEGLEVYTDLEVINLIITTRQQFGIQSFGVLLNKIPEVKTAIMDMLDSESTDEDTVITTVIELIHELVPLSLAWGLLYNKRFELISNTKFLQHVTTLMNMTKEDEHKDILTFVEYVDLVKTHRDAVSARIEAICIHPDVSHVVFNVPLHDTDLVYLPTASAFLYLDVSNLHPAYTELKDDIEFIASHKRKFDHHFEYYILNDAIAPNKQQAIYLVADNIFPHETLEENLNRMRHNCTVAGFTVDTTIDILKYTELCFSSFNNS